MTWRPSFDSRDQDEVYVSLVQPTIQGREESKELLGRAGNGRLGRECKDRGRNDGVVEQDEFVKDIT